MKKKYLFIIIALLIFSSTRLIAHESTSDFQPKGKMIAVSFLDYGFISNPNGDSKRGFNLGRAFLGYNYKFAPNWEARLVIDGASYQTLNADSINSINAYVRNAFLTWEEGNCKLTFGVLGLLEYNLQEGYWGFRYVEKSFQDLNNVGPSVDLGATFEYKAMSWLKFDATFTNGEGTRKIQRSNSARYAVGMTIEPIKGLVFRAYGDIFNKSDLLLKQWDKNMKLQSNVNLKRTDKFISALFLGYRNDKFSCGAEYNKVYNYAFVRDLNYYGFSFYSSVRLGEKMKLFGRYDITKSENVENVSYTWNKKNDGDYALFGMEIQPYKNLKISPNIRTSSRGNEGDFEKQAFVSIEFRL